MDATIVELAASLVEKARTAKVMIATAESCTGGLIAGAITEVPGSSDVFDRGFVTYSNDAKMKMLGVKTETLATFGAVSAETAREMAFGALANSNADFAVAVTGIAGPAGGTPEKPVGLVYIGVAELDGKTQVAEQRLGDIGRSAVRQATLEAALRALIVEIH